MGQGRRRLHADHQTRPGTCRRPRCPSLRLARAAFVRSSYRRLQRSDQARSRRPAHICHPWSSLAGQTRIRQGHRRLRRSHPTRPRGPAPYVCRALAWGRKKEYDNAIADYDMAIKLDPMDAESYYNRAWAWQQKGDNARAMADYIMGVRLDPEPNRPLAEPATQPAGVANSKDTVEEFLRTLPLEHANADDASKDADPRAKTPASFRPHSTRFRHRRTTLNTALPKRMNPSP